MSKVEMPLERALRLIAPGPVTLLTTESRGVANIAACSWVAPVSFAPPMLAVSLEPASLSRRNLEDRGEFVLNVPGRALARQTHFCGKVSGRSVRKDREAELTFEEAGRVRVPIIVECIGHLECVVRESHPAGDHIVYFAEVVLAVAEAGLFDEAWICDDERAKTLHHLGGDFYTSAGPRMVVDPRRGVIA